MTDSEVFKLYTSVVLFILSIGLGMSWYSSQLFPWIYISAFLAVVLILSAQFQTKVGWHSTSWSLALFCLIGVVYRTPMILFPGTLSGNDAEKFALYAQLTLVSGDYTLPTQDFYGIAGGFHTYIAQTAAVSGISPESAMVTVGILFGVWTPLAAAAFCTLLMGRSRMSAQAVIWAGSIAAVATLSVRMTYTPIAHGFGVILLLTFLLAIVKEFSVPDRSRTDYWVVFCLLLGGMMISHKLPVLMAAAIVSGIWLVTRSLSTKILSVSNISHPSIAVPLITILAMVLQQTIITSFISEAIFRTETTAESGFEYPERIGSDPAAAVAPDIGYLTIFESHMHAPVTLAVAGVCWILVAWFLVVRSDENRAGTMAILCTIAFFTSIVLFSLAGATIGDAPHPLRFQVYQEVLLAALIGVGFVIVSKKKVFPNLPKQINVSAILFVVIIVVLSFHAFASVASPDYPGQQRDYLTEGEMSTKEFTVDYVDGPVQTDNRLMRETPYREEVVSKTSPWLRLGGAPIGTQFQSNNIELAEGVAVEEAETLLYRSGEQTYETGATYRDFRYVLEWDVETTADERHNRIQDNGASLVYQDPSI